MLTRRERKRSNLIITEEKSRRVRKRIVVSSIRTSQKASPAWTAWVTQYVCTGGRSSRHSYLEIDADGQLVGGDGTTLADEDRWCPTAETATDGSMWEE